MNAIPDALPDGLVARLSGIVGSGNLRAGDAVARIDPGIDARNLDAGLLVTPSSAEDVAAVIRACAEAGVTVVPQGGRTGLAMGALSEPGQVVVGTAKLNRILSVDPLGGTVTVEAGATLGAVQQAVEGHGYSVGIDMASRDSATIGGMISTNAGGIEAFRHGVMRHRVLGLEAAMPDGTLFSELKRVGKANEGYDIKQLLIGAEGTLGIVTKAVLGLVPLVRRRATALVACDGPEAAVRLFRRFQAGGEGRLLAAEVMWPDYAHTVARELGKENALAFHDDPSSLFVLYEVADDAGEGQGCLETVLGAGLEAGDAVNAVIAKSEAERADFWLIREESFVIDRTYPHGFWYDVSIPLEELGAFAERLFPRVAAIDPRLTAYMMGHLGDGNMHLTISAGIDLGDAAGPAVTEAVYDGLAAVGGSFSAEHGIGLEKRGALARHGAAGKAALMRAIKQALDPHGVMNPGKVISRASG